MIGQKTLQETLKTLANADKLPRFIVIEGAVGSGKKTLAKWLISETNSKPYILPDVKIDTIRSMIQTSYNTRVEMTILIPDADKMSIQAKNSLLKVVEEPPNKIRFILTTTNSELLLSTIKSRATIFRMWPYSQKELIQYVLETYPKLNSEDQKVLADICRNPREIQLFVKYGVYDFLDFVKKVLEYITTAPLYNAMKLINKIALKEDSDGYDLGLFWNTFIFKCFQVSMIDKNETKEESEKYRKLGTVTLNAMQDLNITGINKQMLFDKWLMDIQEV